MSGEGMDCNLNNNPVYGFASDFWSHSSIVCSCLGPIGLQGASLHSTGLCPGFVFYLAQMLLSGNVDEIRDLCSKTSVAFVSLPMYKTRNIPCFFFVCRQSFSKVFSAHMLAIIDVNQQMTLNQCVQLVLSSRPCSGESCSGAPVLCMTQTTTAGLQAGAATGDLLAVVS